MQFSLRLIVETSKNVNLCLTYLHDCIIFKGVFLNEGT